MGNRPRYLVSACLCGIPCRYDGATSADDGVQELVRTGEAVPVCPEVLGGLSIPRAGMDMAWGEGKEVLAGNAPVISKEGENVTPFLLRGAFASLQIARRFRIKKALMKRNSPSCGCGWIKRRGKLKKGDGVTAALFKKEGIKVVPR